MFELFGEFNSFEELNMAADGQLNQGDLESLHALAKENGIEEEITAMFADGDIPYLCDASSAAMGKIEVESEELKPVEIVKDWTEYIKTLCLTEEEVAIGVRKKSKSLKGCIAELLKWSHKNMYAVDKDIMSAAGVTGNVKMGIPGMGNAKKMIRKYYMG